MEIKTKYNLLELVWLIHENKPKELRIIGLEIKKGACVNGSGFDGTDEYYLDYNSKSFKIKENLLFNTKQDLLNSL